MKKDSECRCVREPKFNPLIPVKSHFPFVCEPDVGRLPPRLTASPLPPNTPYSARQHARHNGSLGGLCRWKGGGHCVNWRESPARAFTSKIFAHTLLVKPEWQHAAPQCRPTPRTGSVTRTGHTRICAPPHKPFLRVCAETHAAAVPPVTGFHSATMGTASYSGLHVRICCTCMVSDKALRSLRAVHQGLVSRGPQSGCPLFSNSPLLPPSCMEDWNLALLEN